MRLALLSLLAFFAIAAGPAEEAQRLVDAGQDREAFAMVERATAAGDMDAAESLAWFYDVGRVVKQDRARAAALFRSAAEAGRPHSQWSLGVMLDTGDGVAEDPVEAVRLFRLAAAQNYRRAFTSLAVMYATGRGVARDYAEARRFYDRSARLGEPHGFYGLGVLHREGQGMPVDRVEAAAFMIVAVVLGNRTAQDAMQQSDLTGDEMRSAVARANVIARDFGLDVAPIVYGGDVEGEGADKETVPVA